MDTIVADPKKENLEVTVEETLEEFLGVNIDRREDGRIHLIQPHMIEQIVKYLGQYNPKTPYKSTPAHPPKIVHSHKQSEDFNKSFRYISR